MSWIVPGLSKSNPTPSLVSIKKIIYLLIVSLIAIIISLQARNGGVALFDTENYIPIEIISVIDGDTISVMLDSEKEVVRLIGIDTPEKKTAFTEYECFGDEATTALKNLIKGQDLALSFDPSQQKYDTYDRLLAHLYIVHQGGGESDPSYELVSEIMAKEGYARSYLYEIPDLYYLDIKKAEEYAKSHELGMWRSCDY